MVLLHMGLKRSFFLAEDAIIYSVATGHNASASGPEVVTPWAIPSSANPAGGIISNIHDHLIYARFYLGDGTAASGERILSSDSIAALRQPRLPASWMGDSITLGWYILEMDDGKALMHVGGTNGQRSMLFLIPEHNFGLVVLTNGLRGVEPMFGVGRWLLDSLLKLASPPGWESIRQVFASME